MSMTSQLYFVKLMVYKCLYISYSKFTVVCSCADMSLYYEDICSVLPCRAVDEDEDDTDDNIFVDNFKYQPVVRWSKMAREQMMRSPNSCLNCSTLVIAIGPVATGFIHSYVLHGMDMKTLGAICTGVNNTTVNTLTQRSPSDNSCFILAPATRPDVIIVLCNEDVKAEQTFSWTSMLMSKTCSESTQVIALASSGIVEYQSPLASDDVSSNFIRSISSSTYQGPAACPLLEQPSIVTGLPAQTMTYCQVHSISCVLYMCYTSAPSPEVDTFKAFQPVLRSPPLSRLASPESSADADRRVAKLTNQWSRCSDLLYT